MERRIRRLRGSDEGHSHLNMQITFPHGFPWCVFLKTGTFGSILSGFIRDSALRSKSGLWNRKRSPRYLHISNPSIPLVISNTTHSIPKEHPLLSEDSSLSPQQHKHAQRSPAHSISALCRTKIIEKLSKNFGRNLNVSVCL